MPMTPKEILANVRLLVEEHAQGDPDNWWYANRFVFARLMLDERKTKTAVKKRLIEVGKPCHHCGQMFAETKGIHLHRIDGEKGYSDLNCVLMHGQCHQEHHQEASKSEQTCAAPSSVMTTEPTHSGVPSAMPVEPILTKASKRYDGAFLYWWDIAPNLAAELVQYEAVAFRCKDTGATCLVSVSELKKFLVPARQTTRGDGNWGIKVLKHREQELAFEPPNQNKDWLFLPVTWVEEVAED